MVSRFVDAYDRATNTLRDTHEITDDSIRRVNPADIFPDLDPGLYYFVPRGQPTADYEVVAPFTPLSLGAKLLFWFDASDKTVLFQDTAGTNPVTASGQTIARINDKSPNGYVLNRRSPGTTVYTESGGNAFLSQNGDGAGMFTTTAVTGLTTTCEHYALLRTSDTGDVMLGAANATGFGRIAGFSATFYSMANPTHWKNGVNVGALATGDIMRPQYVTGQWVQWGASGLDFVTGGQTIFSLQHNASFGPATMNGDWMHNILTTQLTAQERFDLQLWLQNQVNPSLAPANLVVDGGFVQVNTEWEGMGASSTQSLRGLGSVGYPYMHRAQLVNRVAAPNRITGLSSDLNGFDVFAAPLYLGATARVFRPVNGQMVLVRESLVTDAKVGKWNWRRFLTSGVEDNRVIDGTTFRFVFDSFNRSNVPYWFRVAAVGSNGLSGAWSSPISYTPTNTSATLGTVTPNTPKAFNRTGSDGALPAPTNFTATPGTPDRLANFSWDAVVGAEGYIVEFSYYDPATQIPSAPYLDLAPDPVPLLVGDFVIIEKEFLTLDDTLYSSRVFNAGDVSIGSPKLFWFAQQIMKRDGNDWSFVPYSGDKPALAVSDFFFRRVAAPGQTALMQYYWHGGSGQGFYKVLQAGRTYRLRIVMRAPTPVTVAFDPGAFGTGLASTSFVNVPSTWTTYTHDMACTAQIGGTSSADWKLTFPGGESGATVDISYFDIEEVGIPQYTLTNCPPAANGYIRDHSFIKPGRVNRSLKELIISGAYSLKGFYDICIEQGARPWYQIEWNAPKQDWIDLVAYFAAPNGSHPMALLRQQSGIPQPLINVFSDIRLEPGNEAWNFTTGFWTFPGFLVDQVTGKVYNNGEVAGLYWQMIANWMKESPYWTLLEPKLKLHIGGWGVNNFGTEAFEFFPDAKEISVAAYNGGWEAGTDLVDETGLSYQSVLADPFVVQRPRAVARIDELKATCAAIGKTYGEDVRYTIYEGGPGYQLDGLNGASLTTAQVIKQEVVMKSRVGAVATVDSMLTYAAEDFLGFTFFAIQPGGYWSAYASPVNGGQEYLVHALPRIVHENIAPARVFSMDTSDFGTRLVTLSGGGTQQMPIMSAYQLRNLADPSKRMIVVINRNIDPSQLPTSDPLYSATPSGTVLMNIRTKWNGAASLKVWTCGVGPYREHNVYPPGTRRDVPAGVFVPDPLCVTFDYDPITVAVPSNLRNFPIDNTVGATAAGLPAGNCLILLFEGVTGG